MSKYVVIRDTREQEGKGWTWRKSKYCDGTVVKKLDTGDYSIEGMEDILSIERKGRVSEFAANVLQKRFERELVRLSEFKHGYILLEFTLADLMMYPLGSGVSKYKTKVRGAFLLKRVAEIMTTYNIQIIFCGKHGKEVAASIIKRVNQMETE